MWLFSRRSCRELLFCASCPRMSPYRLSQVVSTSLQHNKHSPMCWWWNVSRISFRIMGSVNHLKSYLTCPRTKGRTFTDPLLEGWTDHCSQCTDEWYECMIVETTLENTLRKRLESWKSKQTLPFWAAQCRSMRRDNSVIRLCLVTKKS